MKALTIWQPWASLIICGAKPWEWRKHKAPRSVVGQEIVIHAGLRRVVMSEIEDLIYDLEHDDRFQTGLVADLALELLRPVLAGKIILPTGAGLGTARLGAPRHAVDIFPGRGDSDRIEHQKWGWPLSEIQPFIVPIPLQGAQGFWTWPDAHQLADAA